jgi:hypothetical protein
VLSESATVCMFMIWFKWIIAESEGILEDDSELFPDILTVFFKQFP